MNEMNKGLISIIVPVYNVEAYVGECIESILNQTYRNIELLLINDGSTDKSGIICKEYAKNDSRIRFIDKENEGVSATRNKGIQNAIGEFIVFVDSDDWIDANFCEELLNTLVESKSQISMCAYIREYPDASLVKEILPGDEVMSRDSIRRKLCGPIDTELRYPENVDSFNSMCGKIYLSKIIKKKNIKDLSVIGSSEDLLFNFEVCGEIESLAYINKPLYHYRKVVNNSITATYRKNLLKQWNTLYDMMLQIISVEKLDETYIEALCNRIALNTLGLGLNCVADDVSFFEKRKRIKHVITEKRRRDALKKLSIKNMPIHWKIFYGCSKLKFSTVVCVLLIIINNLRGKV